MWPDQVSNSGPLALESYALSTALRGPFICVLYIYNTSFVGSIRFVVVV